MISVFAVSNYSAPQFSWHSKSNLKLNIDLNSLIEFDLVRFSSTIERNRTHQKEKNQSNPNERSILELVICVKQALKIQNQILEARVTA